MKLIAKSNVYVSGKGVVSKGKEIEWNGDFPLHFYGNFMKEDGTPLVKDETQAPTVETKPNDDEGKKRLVASTAKMGKTKIIAHLDKMSVAYDEKMTATELAKIYLTARGEKID